LLFADFSSFFAKVIIIRLLFSGRDTSSTQKVDCPIFNDERRNGILKNKNGSVFLCTNDKELIKGTRVFKEKLEIHGKYLPELNDIKNELTAEIRNDSQILLHNIVNLNAKVIQDIHVLVDSEQLGENYRSQITNLKLNFEDNPNDWAIRILNILKTAYAIKSEITVFQSLLDDTMALDFKSFSIRKVVLNTFHRYFQDFSEKDVHVDVLRSNKYLLIDFEIFQVALSHFAHNAVKYTAPSSNITVNFFEKDNHFYIQFSMLSIQIKDEEIYEIRQKGYSGEYAKEINKSGHGLGMYMISKILDLHNAKLEIEVDAKRTMNRIINRVPYECNIFTFIF
jgi:light-regulated signal transduction histidine kinase (bacteriophytochrome)